jgi:hypothetical protein
LPMDYVARYATCAVKDADGDDVLPMRDWRTQSGSLAALPLVEIR